jgi:hypothetical protein
MPESGPDILEHAYMRASLSLALQGLLRGAEFAVDGKFNPLQHMTRADLVSGSRAMRKLDWKSF